MFWYVLRLYLSRRTNPGGGGRDAPPLAQSRPSGCPFPLSVSVCPLSVVRFPFPRPRITIGAACRTASLPARRRCSWRWSSPCWSCGSAACRSSGPDEPRYARVAVEMQRAVGVGHADAPGRALAREAAALLLAGRAPRSGSSARRRRRPASPRCSRCSLLTGATALFGARLYGSAAGLHAGFVAGTALLPFAYGRAASMDMLLAATVTLAIGLSGLRLAGDRGAHRLRGRRGRRRARDARQGPARPAAAGRWSSAGYLLSTREWRRLREVLAPGAFVAFAARGRSLVRRDPARPGAALPGRLHPEPQRRSASPRRSTTTPGRSGTTCRCCCSGSSPGRGSRCPALVRTRAARVAERPLRPALAAAAARLLLARRLQAARLHPPVRAPARDPDGPGRRPADPRGTRRPSAGCRAGRWPSSASCSARSSPRRRPRSSACRSRCGARPSRSACGRVVVAFFFSRRVGVDPAGRAARCCASGRPACSS